MWIDWDFTVKSKGLPEMPEFTRIYLQVVAVWGENGEGQKGVPERSHRQQEDDLARDSGGHN